MRIKSPAPKSQCVALLSERGYAPADIPRGTIIAVAEIACCEQVPVVPDWERCVPDEPERSFGFYWPDRWMWTLANVRRLTESVPTRGMLGLWRLPPLVIGAVAAQLASGSG